MSHHTRRGSRAISAASLFVALLLATSLLAGCGALPTASESGGTSTMGYGDARTGDQAVGTAPEAMPPVAEDTVKAADESMPSPSGDVAGAGAAKLEVVNKTMRVETEDVDDAIARIRTLASKAGGDIANMQVATALDEPVYRPTEDGSPAADSAPLKAYLTVRVPVAGYAGFVEAVAGLGRVLAQSEAREDVTQQHVDMKARLDNLKAEAARLRQLFSRARTVTEMLEVERELTRVQGEIESLTAQIAYLERQAAKATVTIELTEPRPLVRPAGTDWGVAAAFTQSVRAFVDTINVLIVILGPVLALALFVGLPVGLVIRALFRRANRKRAEALAAAEAAQQAYAGDEDVESSEDAG